jgi:ribosomal protein L22
MITRRNVFINGLCSRAGKWRSEWTFRFKEDESQGTLKGTVAVNVHYFEDGNVQLNSHKEFEKVIEICVSINGENGTHESNVYVNPIYLSTVSKIHRLMNRIEVMRSFIL